MRKYKKLVPTQDDNNEIIAVAIMTPSDKNGQPRRIKIINDKQLIDSIYHPYLLMGLG